MAVSIFPPEMVGDIVKTDIMYILSSQIVGFLFTAIFLITIFKVYSINEYIKFELNFNYLLLSISAFFVAVMLINFVNYFQKELIPVYLTSSYLSSQNDLYNSYAVLASILSENHIIFLYLIGALLPAVCEEFFFRGYLLQLCLSQYSKLKSITIVSFLFAVMHFQIIAMLPLFIFGFILGLLTLKTGRLNYAIVVHFLNNAITLYIFTN